MPLPRRPTQADIARSLGVSQVTVSKALRGVTSISGALRKKVARRAAELGYRPDPMLSALVAYRGQEVRAYQGAMALLLTRTFMEGRYSRIAQLRAAAEAAAAQLGYRVEIFAIHESTRKDQAVANIMRARGIRGALIDTYPLHFREVRVPLERFATVAFMSDSTVPGVMSVVSNHAHGMRETLTRLAAAGYRKPMAVIHESLAFVQDDWLSAAAYYGKRTFGRPLPVIQYDSRPIDRTLARLAPLFARRGIDALIHCGNEAFIDALRRFIAIPGNLGFCSLDVQDPSTGCAGIRQNYDEIVAAAVRLLHAALISGDAGIIRRPSSLQIQGEWIDGWTLPPRKSRDREASKHPAG